MAKTAAQKEPTAAQRIKAAENDVLLQRTSARVEELLNLGLLYQEEGNIYLLGDAKISVEEIKILHDDVWDACVKNIISTIDAQNDIPLSEGEMLEFSEATLAVVDTDKKNVAMIESWKKACTGLDIKDLKDKPTYEKVSEAKRFIRKKRTTLEKTRKEMKEEILERGRAIDRTAKRYASLLEEIESPLDAQLTKWEAWKDEERTRKEREEQAELDRRVQVLKEAGMTFNGMMYVIGQTRSIDLASIKAMSQADLNVLVGLVTMDKKKIDEDAEAERVAEQARKAKEGADRVELKRQQDELAENQRKQADELIKFNKEKAELAKQKQNMRCDRCKAIGMSFNFSENHYEFINDFLFAHIPALDIQCMDDKEYNNLIENCKTKITEAKAQQSEKDEADRKKKEQDEADRKDNEAKANQQFLDRRQQLIDIGMRRNGNEMIYQTPHQCMIIEFTEIRKCPVDKWQSFVALQSVALQELDRAAKEQVAKEAAAKEAAKSEIQRMNEYLAKIEAIDPPLFEDAKVIALVKPFFNFMKEAIEGTKERLSAL